MPLESATYPADLVTSNPPTSDLETQGANHLQLIKAVLQNCFGTAVRRYVGLPTTTVISNSLALTVSSGGNVTFLVNTGAGAISITLPPLAASDAGWECSVIKTTNDLNPIFLVPPAGTIQSGEYTGLTKARRCIPGRRTRVVWSGTGFVAERADPRPIGTIFDNMFATLPVGYEWANGQTLSSSANYPEYFSLNSNSGLTPDIRGRATFGLDNVGAAGNSGRITVAGGNFDGTVAGSSGGAQNHTLALAEAPTGQLTLNFTDPGHKHTGEQTFDFTSTSAGHVAIGGTTLFGTHDTPTASTGITCTLTDHAGGGPHTILPPAYLVSKLLVVE